MNTSAIENLRAQIAMRGGAGEHSGSVQKLFKNMGDGNLGYGGAAALGAGTGAVAGVGLTALKKILNRMAGRHDDSSMVQNGLQGAAAGSIAGLGVQALSGKGGVKSAADSALSKLIRNLSAGGAMQIKNPQKMKQTLSAISNKTQNKPDPRTAITGRMKSASEKKAARIINGDVGLNVIIERLKLARSKHGQSKTAGDKSAGILDILKGLGIGAAPAAARRIKPIKSVKPIKPQVNINQLLAKRLKKPTLTTNPPLVLAGR